MHFNNHVNFSAHFRNTEGRVGIFQAASMDRRNDRPPEARDYRKMSGANVGLHGEQSPAGPEFDRHLLYDGPRG